MKRQAISYGIGAIAKDMVYALVSGFILYYYNTVLGISATFTGIMMMAPSASSTVITSPSAAKQAALTPHSAIASGTIASASCRCSSVSGTSASQRISRHAYTGTSTVLFGASPPLCIIASIVCDSCCSCSCVMRGFTCFLEGIAKERSGG